jgi:hypothetical protein
VWHSAAELGLDRDRLLIDSERVPRWHLLVQRASQFLRQNIVALLALTLVLGGGAAFAARTKLPKNSVASKQVKNNSLKGKDLTDGSVTGADLGDASVTGTDLQDGGITGTDLQDGGITGTDLRDGSVGASDLAPDAADEVRVFFYTGGNATVFEVPGLLKATFSCAGNSVNSFAALSLSPGRAGVYGLEDLNAGSEPAGTAPLVGAATVSRLGDVGMPVGGAGFGGSVFGLGQLVMFFQTPKMDVYIDLKISLCGARGTISIDHKPQGSTITRPVQGQPNVVCESTGAAYCSEQAA